MRALLRGLALVFLLTLAGLTPAGAQTQPERILVLLQLPAEHLHAGGNSVDGYGSGADRAARRRIADRVARAHGLTLVDGWPMPLVGLDCFVMALPPDRTPSQAVEALSHDREVAWSEPVHTFHAQEAKPPNDPLYPLQPAAREWRLAELHQVSTGRHVRVAVVDSAVDVAHPDLKGQVGLREDFVGGRGGVAELHGTGVAGIIAAVADNRLGIAGIAPGAQLMALRACWQEAVDTLCDSLSLAKALHFAIEHDAQVINLSLAGPPDTLLGRLIDVALARNIVVVGAVDPSLAQGGFPASHAGVVAVASEPGPGPGVYAAPGRDVPTTQPGGRWGLVNGSSFAAAHVSGLFALMDERHPHARREGLVTARASGAIDACATLQQTSGPCRACACAQASRYSANARP